MALSYLIKPDPHCLPPTTAMIDEVPDDTPTNQVPLLDSQVHQTLKPPKYHWYASRYLCLITALVLLCFSVIRAANGVQTYFSRRRRQVRPTNNDEFHRPPLLRTVTQQMVQRWTVLVTLPSWLYGPDTLLDAMFTASYCSLLFYFALNHSRCEYGRPTTTD